MRKVHIVIFMIIIILSGCTTNQIKKEKELKYPEWPGLDEKIEVYEYLLEFDKEQQNELINFNQMKIDSEDIKWHIRIMSYKGQIDKIIENYPVEVYRNKCNETYLLLVKDMDKLNSVYLDLAKRIKPFGASIGLNPLLEFSKEHYSPFSKGFLTIMYCDDLSKEEIEKQERELGIFKYKMSCHDNPTSYPYGIPDEINFVDLWVRLEDSQLIECVVLWPPTIPAGKYK